MRKLKSDVIQVGSYKLKRIDDEAERLATGRIVTYKIDNSIFEHIKGGGLLKAQAEACMDCECSPPYYMVKDEVWWKAVPDYIDVKVSRRKDMRFTRLCFKCLSIRLGRPLDISDFSSAPVNNLIHFGYSLAK